MTKFQIIIIVLFLIVIYQLGIVITKMDYIDGDLRQIVGKILN